MKILKIRKWLNSVDMQNDQSFELGVEISYLLVDKLTWTPWIYFYATIFIRCVFLNSFNELLLLFKLIWYFLTNFHWFPLDQVSIHVALTGGGPFFVTSVNFRALYRMACSISKFLKQFNHLESYLENAICFRVKSFHQ